MTATLQADASTGVGVLLSTGEDISPGSVARTILVDKAVLGKTESDTRADFANGYDFNEAFVAPFLPPQRTAKPKTARQRSRKGPSKSSQQGDATDAPTGAE